MEPITTRNELEMNLSRLDSYRRSRDAREREFYKRLLSQGICFVGFRHEGVLIFGPSRFVGYANNDLRRHQRNQSKDGRVTNRAIVRILGYQPGHDEQLEREYLRACAEVSVRPRQTGPFRTKRKFWSEP